MANSTIGVNLKFSADVSAAKKAMQDLQGSLANINNLSMNSKIGTSYASDLNRASQAAAQLRIQLQNAFNQDTGKLNLAKFNQELKTSGMSIAKYKQELSALGPQGEQAFNQLAYSIATAENKTFSLNAGLQRLGATFMNTLRYQLSSSVIMAFTQGVSEAVDFTKELNTSLNNIRIVTGYGVDEMKEFANYANKSAKALSTSTKAMTDASLIYFQQGLGMEEAQKRAETTVKLANVTGESVQTVSDQLTAIWNNFYDGSKALEYYADVITKLGAATASSTDEISEGLEKFAAVAETVGLSYEYATAALATVTSETRQSADVVGTAFKTLFARIQDLELGKTLDDGVTLGKYSQALDVIGVKILDSSGNVKDMNTILDEMGAKWNTISTAQQVSVAQTVAGVRQYTQLISLMENWDKVQGNVTLAQTSSGELQKQQEIYAESWEAAAERVGAAAESIYQSLLNDEAFIDIMDFFSDFLGVIDKAIDGLGGLPGVLTLVGTALMKAFSPQIAAGINNIAYGMMSLTKGGRAKLGEIQTEANNILTKSAEAEGLPGTENESRRTRAKMRQSYNKNSQNMSETARRSAEAGMQAQEEKYDEYFKSDNYQTNKEIIQEVDQNVAEVRKGISKENREKFDAGVKQMRQAGAASELQNKFSMDNEAALSSLTDGVPIDEAGMAKQEKSLAELESRLKSIGVEGQTASEHLKNVVGDNVAQEYEEYAQKVNLAKEALEKLRQAEAMDDADPAKSGAVAAASAEYDTALNNLGEMENKLTSATQATQELGATNLKEAGATDAFAGSQKAAGVVIGEVESDIANLNQGTQGLQEGMDRAASAGLDFGTKMQNAAQLGMSVAMTINAIKGAIDVLNNEDMTWGEKILSISTSLLMVLPMLISSLGSLNIAQKLNTLGQIAETKAQQKDILTNIVHKKTEDDLAKSKGQKPSSGGDMPGGGLDAGGKKALGKLAGTAVIVTAAILAGKAIKKAADEAYRKDEIAAEKAEAASQKLAEANEKAAASYKELQDTSTSYVDSIKSLDDMTKGTQEYQDAVDKANESALKMIDTYDELAGQYHTTAEGLIVFNEGALENIQLLERQRKNAAATAAAIGRQNARDARAEANKTEFLREKVKSNEGSEYTTEDQATVGKGLGTGLVTGGAVMGGAALIGTMAAGTKIGAALGSIAGPLGTAIGVAAGAAIGLAVGGVIAAVNKDEATKQEKKAIDTLAKAYDKMGDAALTPDKMKDLLGEEGITDPKLIDSLNANKDELQKLMLEIKANTEARKAENLNLAREQMSTIDKSFSSFDESIQSAMANIDASMRTKKQDEIEYDAKDYSKGKWYTLGIAKGGTKQGKEAFDAWKKSSGKKDIDDVDFKGDKITYSYVDEDGKRQKGIELSYEELAAWQEGQEISKQTEENYTKIKEAVFDIASQKGGAGVLSALSGQDPNELTKDQFEALRDAYNSGEFEDELANLGSIAGTEYAEEIRNAIENTLENWDADTALTKFMRKTKAEVDNILEAGSESTGVSKKALDNYTESLLKNQSALNGNGKALNDWQKTANKKIAAEMAVANAKFAQGVVQLNDVMKDSIDVLLDWNELSLDTWEAVGKVQEALENAFGVNVSAEFIHNNLEKIQQLANGDVSSLEELQEAAARDYVLNLEIADDAKNSLLSMLNKAIDLAENEADGIVVDATLDDSSYINQLNEMLEAGEITAEEVKKTFGAIGYAVDVRTTKKQVANTSTYEMTGPTGTYKGTITNYTEMEVPYIAGSDTADAGVASKVEGDKTMYQTKSKGDGFTYTGGANDVKGGLVANINKEETKTIEDKRKALEDDVDKYHEEKEVLSDIERSLNKIAKAKDRAWGTARLKQMDKEISALEKQQKATESLAKAQMEEVASRQETLAKERGAIFDENGNVSNWEELREQMNATYLAEYENASPERREELDEWREKFIKDFEDYESLLDEAKDNSEEAAEIINEIFSKKLEKIQYELEIKVEVDDRELRKLERSLKKLDDPIYDGIKAIGKLDEKIATNMKKADTYTKKIQDVFAQTLGDAVYDIDISTPEGYQEFLNMLEGKELTAEQVEMLQSMGEELYNIADAMEEDRSQQWEYLINGIAQLGTESQEASSKIQTFTSVLQNLGDMIDVLGAKSFGISDDTILAISDAQVQGAIGNLQQLQTAYETSEAAYKDAKAAYDKAKDDPNVSDEDKQKLKEALDAAEQQRNTDYSNLYSGLNSALQTIAKDFDTTMDIAIRDFEKKISGTYDSIKAMSDAFNQQQEISQRYLADYEKVYELTKLNRDLNKSISDTDSVRGKQELLKLQQEINELEESGVEMSQYDIDALRKKYELRVAEIALEEAQNNKSVVRMRRDSEGNMSYVYTADQDDVAEKQQNYEDKMYESAQLNEEYIAQQDAALIKNKEELINALEELKARRDEFESEEAYQKAYQDTVDYYSKREEYILTELQKGVDNNAELYETDWSTYAAFNDKKVNKYAEMLEAIRALDRLDFESDEEYMKAVNEIKRRYGQEAQVDAVTNAALMMEEISALRREDFATEEAYLAAVNAIREKYQYEALAQQEGVDIEMLRRIGEIDSTKYATEEDYLKDVDKIKNEYIVENEKKRQAEIDKINADDTLSAEQKKQKIEEINKKYEAQAKSINDAAMAIIKSNEGVYKGDWEAYEDYVTKEEETSSGLKTTFGDTATSIVGGYEDVDDALDESKKASEDLIPKVTKAYSDFKRDAGQALQTVGLDWKNLNKELPTLADNSVKQINKINLAYQKWAKEAQKALDDMFKTLGDPANLAAFNAALQPYIDAANNWNDLITDALSAQVTTPETKLYRGTYTDGTNTYVTKEYYADEASAKLAAQEEAKQMWKDMENQAQYQQSLGDRNAVANFNKLKSQNESNVGSVAEADVGNKTSYTDQGDKQVFHFKSDKGNDHYLSHDTTGLSKESFVEHKDASGKTTRYQIKGSYGYYIDVTKEDFDRAKTFFNLGSVTKTPQAPQPTQQAPQKPVEPKQKTVMIVDKYQAGKHTEVSKDTAIDWVEHCANDYLIKIGGTQYIIDQQEYDAIKGLGGSFVNTLSGSGDSKSKDPGFEVGDKVSSNGKKIKPYSSKGNNWVFYSAEVLDPSTIKEVVYPSGKSRFYWTGDMTQEDYKIYYKESDLISSYDTGGYTGSWDSSGRLAMLHQKEIVLNASDTENFLAAISIVRDIAKAIDLQAAAYQSSLGSIASTNISTHPQTIQQDITIHAEFPHATDRFEIEAAFDNIINRASQFANRKI